MKEQANICQLPIKEENQRRKNISQSLFSKLRQLIKAIHHEDQQSLEKHLKKLDQDNTLIILPSNQVCQQAIKNIFEQSIDAFLKYLRISGCKINNQQISKQQGGKKFLMHIISFKYSNEQLNIREQIGPKIQFCPPHIENNQILKDMNMGHNATLGEVSLELALRKNELDYISINQEKQFKQQVMESLYRNIRQSNKIVQLTIYKILTQSAIKEENKQGKNKEEILENITQIRDRMSECQGVLVNCIKHLSSNQEKQNEHKVEKPQGI